MTQECLNTYTTYFACKISTLSTKYYKQLNIGDKCAHITLFKIQFSKALLKQICDLVIESRNPNNIQDCLTEDEICNIIDILKDVLDKDKCKCEC